MTNKEGYGIGATHNFTFFELSTTDSQFSAEGFQRTCVDKEFTSFTDKFGENLGKIAKFYLKILQVENKNVEKAILWTVWAWKSLSIDAQSIKKKEKYFKERFDKQRKLLENLYVLIETKKNFNQQEMDLYQIIYDLLLERFKEEINKIINNNPVTNPLRISLRRDFSSLGNPNRFKEEYFGVPSYKILDNYIKFITHHGKECEKLPREQRIPMIIDVEKKYQKSHPDYPFGKGSTFKKGDEESSEYKQLEEFKLRWFRYMILLKTAVSKIRFCLCSSFKRFYEEKEKELRQNGESLDALLKERDFKLKAITQTCSSICEKRKEFMKKLEIQNEKTKQERMKEIEKNSQ